jgi:hypothetical protein
MRALTLSTLALACVMAGSVVQAGPGYSGRGGGGGTHFAPAHGYGGARWAGGPYRPGYGPGYGGWRYGYPGYGYGYGYGYGFGLGLGYGTGWALTTAWPWYWGAPAYYPWGYLAPGYPALSLDEELSYVQQPQAEVVAPPARRAASYWYYCTEPAGYYPYVQQCARPWIAVQPNAVPPAGSAPGAPAQ